MEKKTWVLAYAGGFGMPEFEMNLVGTLVYLWIRRSEFTRSSPLEITETAEDNHIHCYTGHVSNVAMSVGTAIQKWFSANTAKRSRDSSYYNTGRFITLRLTFVRLPPFFFLYHFHPPSPIRIPVTVVGSPSVNLITSGNTDATCTHSL